MIFREVDGCKLILRASHLKIVEENTIKVELPLQKSCEHSMCKLATFVNGHSSTSKDEIVEGFYLLQGGEYTHDQIYYDLAALIQNAILDLEFAFFCVTPNQLKLQHIGEKLEQ